MSNDKLNHDTVDALVRALRIVREAIDVADHPARRQNLEKAHALLEEAAVRLDCELAMRAPIGSKA